MARLAEARPGEPTLLLAGDDGELIELPLEALSPADQAHVRSIRAGQAAAAGGAAPPAADPLTHAAVNRAFGLPIWSEHSLWQEQDDKVAGRLAWPRESRTSTLSSYRLYPNPPLEVLARQAYALALYAEEGSPVMLSMIFANKGDVDRMMGLGPDSRDSDIRRAARDYQRLIRDDERALEEALSALFGTPETTSLGESRATMERVSRWQWEDCVFLLSAPRDEYVNLRIIPAGTDSATGIVRQSRRDLRQVLATGVEKRPGGDLVISEIPMVNQGPKGYCVPASWERVLRYMGIPADMYVLAMAGSTGIGGGTSLSAIENGVRTLVQRHGRRIESRRDRMTVSNVARFIDQGIPIIWHMVVHRETNRDISRRTRQRAGTTDWESWDKSLRPIRNAARRMRDVSGESHVCLIIGYNEATGEIAISDSWGPRYAERWLTVEEAEAISRGTITLVMP